MGLEVEQQAPMNVFDATCTSRGVLAHATGRWGALTLAALFRGPLRFGELRRAVQGISDRLLVQTLKQLESDGLVARTAHQDLPSRVDYELTELGRPISERVCELIDTIYAQLPGIVAHQRAHPSQ